MAEAKTLSHRLQHLVVMPQIAAVCQSLWAAAEKMETCPEPSWTGSVPRWPCAGGSPPILSMLLAIRAPPLLTFSTSTPAWTLFHGSVALDLSDQTWLFGNKPRPCVPITTVTTSAFCLKCVSTTSTAFLHPPFPASSNLSASWWPAETLPQQSASLIMWFY